MPNAARTTRAYASRVGNQTGDKTYKFVDVFRPLKWSIPALNSKAPVLLLTGSAGGGKSMAAAQKVHAYLLAYPGATALVVRKTQTSMFNSTIAFLKKKVMGRYLRNGMVRHLSTQKRFEYRNGSVMVYSGMANDDQKEAIRSAGQEGGIDIIWMEEATQFDEGDFDELTGRLRGTKGDFRQIILSTNPDTPTHWIYRRLILGEEAEVHYSSATDNLYNPKDYLETLKRMRGVEGQRLRDGLWIQAGGLVLDSWLDDYGNTDGLPSFGNVTTKADFVRGAGPVLWWVDDGYSGEVDKLTGMFKARSHPRVFLFVQLRYDGTLAIFFESYKVKTLAPEHIREVIALTKQFGFDKPSRVIYDKAAASLGGHLKKELKDAWRMPATSITYMNVPVEQGNRETNTWLAPDQNGVRRILVHPRLKHLRLEMVTYKVNPKTGRVVKDFDHGTDAIRMGVWDQVYGGPSEVDVAGMPTEIVGDDPDGIVSGYRSLSELEDNDIYGGVDVSAII